MPNPINVNRNVYQAIKDATTDGYFSSPRINNSDERQAIESAIAADGEIDNGERQVLDALRSNTSFTVKAQGESPYDVSSGLVSFPSGFSSSATGNVTGRVAHTADDGIHPIPAHIPEQTVGRQTDYYETRVGGNYAAQRATLLDVNNWGKSGMMSADFQLVDGQGNEINNRPPRVGDFIQIALPGSSMIGNDYVQIESIIDNDDMTSITVRPSRDPGSSSTATDHFFTSDATNTFTLRRTTSTDGEPLSVMQVNGRNEVPNSGAKNWAVTTGADYTPMQTWQWEGMLDHVLDAQ
ncbi:MAG: hypothetical protein IGS03_18450 [Candidatus Sericytochromatia bacterium]|nr:hypothetical protein [Candidatus Sericytochromatia bacterium]